MLKLDNDFLYAYRSEHYDSLEDANSVEAAYTISIEGLDRDLYKVIDVMQIAQNAVNAVGGKLAFVYVIDDIHLTEEDVYLLSCNSQYLNNTVKKEKQNDRMDRTYGQ